ncbi:hypothetical protein B5X24_HaOG211909 [Helicoverpa armigera]|uniref:Uncharacterized protein n=1 Tax=Helicoverpa armigera TaxID=29058 RepID=A0A2W1BKC2_HELAM|nr:hypothetical protein B5X24_HaOG211909 [Helicoverpa armigera]
MDLIEVLWKQDVDMGFSLEDPVQPEGPTATKVLGDEIEKELKLAEEKIVKKNEEKAEIEKVKASLLDPEIKEEGPTATKVLGDEIEKELKLAEEKIVKKNEEKAEIEKVKASLLDPEIKEDDPWAGLSYTVDTETGK